MLVYVNNFLFEPAQGPDQIVQLVAKWVGQRAKGYIDAARLAEGIRELKLKDGSTLTSRATWSDDKGRAYPFWFCAQLSHRDEKISGRRWITEIGLHQEAEWKPIECSLLLRTDEVSARVTAPIQVTRPKLIEQLIQSCDPLGQTPGLKVKRLTMESASAFLREVERNERDYPIAILSANRDGQYPVAPERLRSIVVGLADVVCVPPEEDTFAIEELVGRRFMAFGGALNIVFPGRQGGRGLFYETVLLRHDEIADLLDSGHSIESEVLSTITHRTNLPFSWRHISPEKVGQAALRAQLSQMSERAKAGDQSEELTEYVALLESADQELQSKDKELARIRSNYEEKEQEVRALEADIANLKHALSGLQSSYDGMDEVAEALVPLRDSVAAVLKGSHSLQQTVDLIATLYSDRIVFLETAKSSAKESDRGGFRQGAKAFEMLQKLATEYWQQLADGKSDQQAKTVFGQNAYAANEASALSNDGKRRRTFSYRGRDFLMEKHLKHGVKDSLAETLRVHFEWLAHEKKIIVGHCGKHLNF
ncbi:MAG: coiled-coil domain-containing protein [Acidiferrobacter sp.]